MLLTFHFFSKIPSTQVSISELFSDNLDILAQTVSRAIFLHKWLHTHRILQLSHTFQKLGRTMLVVELLEGCLNPLTAT